MSALSRVADGAGAILAALALPIVILAIGIPFAFVTKLALAALGLL